MAGDAWCVDSQIGTQSARGDPAAAEVDEGVAGEFHVDFLGAQDGVGAALVEGVGGDGAIGHTEADAEFGATLSTQAIRYSDRFVSGPALIDA
ncbi:hypothetical protein [Micromonospora sp. HK10]|uniref:hypothetical protein n=1 Tax=Micromonospora sp. HK10 TaxID=1538294 RepID=UPI000626FDC4|nr:hypothetical protein [Micromonospora sp. HK10]KKK00544.1 hypothetical protein LQ51_21420 [Micromonospora sp. HK10]